MSRGALVLLIVVASLGAYLWLVELPGERTRVESEATAKQLVDFKESDVQGFIIHSSEGDIEIRRNADGTWHILKPREMEADPQSVDEFLRALILARVSRVVDDTGSDLASYGLASPSVTVTIRLASGTQVLRFGDPGPLSSSLYASRASGPQVLLTSIAGHQIMSKSLQDFRRKRVFEFDRDKVTRMKITTPQEIIVLYKEGHGDKADWKIKTPVETAADQPEVRSLLFALQDLKAQGFLDDPKDRRGKISKLGTPLVALTIHEAEADRTLTLYQDARTKTVYVETTEQEPLYVLSSAAKDIPKSLFVLRNKQLIAAEPDRVKTLVVKQGNQEYSLTHEGNDWLIDGDPGAKADGARINMFVSRTVRLQAERIVTDKPANLHLYGLQPPEAELIAADAQGKVLGRVALGKQTGGLAYAQGSAMPGIFEVRADILNDLPKKEELKAHPPPATTGGTR